MLTWPENQLPYWRSLVESGRELAGKTVPVVLFHDWGFGETPFPWMAVSPADRELWMRTRGAEIYAAGGFFAFPVLGPFGCNAAQDGTLGCIATQAAFYQAQRSLYLKSRYLGCEVPHVVQQPPEPRGLVEPGAPGRARARRQPRRRRHRSDGAQQRQHPPACGRGPAAGHGAISGRPRRTAGFVPT